MKRPSRAGQGEVVQPSAVGSSATVVWSMSAPVVTSVSTIVTTGASPATK